MFVFYTLLMARLWKCWSMMNSLKQGSKKWCSTGLTHIWCPCVLVVVTWSQTRRSPFGHDSLSQWQDLLLCNTYLASDKMELGFVWQCCGAEYVTWYSVWHWFALRTKWGSQRSVSGLWLAHITCIQHHRQGGRTVWRTTSNSYAQSTKPICHNCPLNGYCWWNHSNFFF